MHLSFTQARSLLQPDAHQRSGSRIAYFPGTDSVSPALTKSQVTYTSEGNGLIRLVGTTFAADLYNVEKLVFTDQTVTLA